MGEYRHIKREFGPVYDGNSRILILGSFPSVKSREAAFFYGHPQNRFWKVMENVIGVPFPEDKEGKTEILKSHRIALWDVIDECDIVGSSDSSVKNAVPVDIMKVLNAADIRGIYCNGSTSYNLYRRLLESITGMEAVRLPSTSPANASWTIDGLTAEWKIILEKLCGK